MKLSKFFFFSFIFFFLLMGFSLASMGDVKTVVCNDINLTEPNCTTWWDTLNLTENNFTTNFTTNYTNINVTVIYNNLNQTGNLSNLTETYNKSDTYNKTEIDNKISSYISSSDINVMIDNKLSPYALKTEINDSKITITKDLESGWKWAGIISILFMFIMVIAIFIRGGTSG